MSKFMFLIRYDWYSSSGHITPTTNLGQTRTFWFWFKLLTNRKNYFENAFQGMRPFQIVNSIPWSNTAITCKNVNCKCTYNVFSTRNAHPVKGNKFIWENRKLILCYELLVSFDMYNLNRCKLLLFCWCIDSIHAVHCSIWFTFDDNLIICFEIILWL